MDHTPAPSQRGRGRPRGPVHLQEMREELTAKNQWLLNPSGSYYEKRSYLNSEPALHRRLRAYIRAGDRNLCAVCHITEERGTRSWLEHFNTTMHQTNERQELVGMTCDELVILSTKPNCFSFSTLRQSRFSSSCSTPHIHQRKCFGRDTTTAAHLIPPRDCRGTGGHVSNSNTESRIWYDFNVTAHLALRQTFNMLF